MRCGNCGNENPEGSHFCIKCGKELGAAEPGIVTCPHCGVQIASGALFCSACGKSIGAPYGDVSQGRTFDSPLPEPDTGSFSSNIALDIILSVITCGIYWFFWQARQMRAINYLLGQQRYNFWLWFLLTIVTCSLFNIYYEYYMAQGIVEAQDKRGFPQSRDLPVLSLILAIIGLNIVTDAIQQNAINKIFGK
ncbi:MAG: zinc-ribbon domain-containing protein [Syntrophorhabdaceae bacterium]|nr:zinc-ribbon domain-containing protein [Syntrophorhabdaceae bacterium]